jgi:hypothetical protein
MQGSDRHQQVCHWDGSECHHFERVLPAVVKASPELGETDDHGPDERPPIVSVWSSYGHRFMSTDSPEHKSCLTCGAMYQLVDHFDGSGEYTAGDGSQPMACTGDTTMSHGYPGERDDDNGRLTVDHDCNCLFCNS